MDADTTRRKARRGGLAAALPELSGGQLKAAIAAITLLVLAGVWTLWPFLPALGWAAIFAVALWPFYSRCCERWPRHTGILLPGAVTFLILLIFVLPLVMVGAAIAHDSAAFAQWLQQAAAKGVPPPPLLASLPYGDHITAWWQGELARPENIRLWMQSGATSWLRVGAGGRVVGAVLHRLLLVVFMLLILFFLLREGDRVAKGLRIGSSRAFGPAGEHVAEQIIQTIRGTVNGLVVVGLGEGVVLGIAYVATGVPHPALLGLLTGLLSAIPFGAVAGYLAAAALLAINGQVGAAVVIAIIGSVVVFLADHFVRPALMAALVLLWREWVGVQPGPLNQPPVV
jgi:predicted PurR-regulated permease PerM